MKKSNKTKQGLELKARQTLTALATHDTITAAADDLHISRKTLYDRIERYGLKPYLERLPEIALTILQHGSVQAANVLVSGLYDNRVKYEKASEILDRVGVGVHRGPQSLTQVNVGGEMGVKIATYDPNRITQEPGSGI